MRKQLSPSSLGFCIPDWSNDDSFCSSSIRGFNFACKGDWLDAVDAFTETLLEAEESGDAVLIARALVNRATAHIGVATRASFISAARDAAAAEVAVGTFDNLLLARARSRAGVAAYSLGFTDAARHSLLAAIAGARAAAGGIDAEAVLSAVAAGYTQNYNIAADAALVVTSTEGALADLERAILLSSDSSSGSSSEALFEGSDDVVVGKRDEFVELLDWLQPGKGGGGGEAEGEGEGRRHDEMSSIRPHSQPLLPRCRPRTPSPPHSDEEIDPFGGRRAGGGGDSSISTFPFLSIRRYGSGDYRGVHARCDVAPETELMAVGEDYCITVERAKEHPIVAQLTAACIDRELSASKHCYLALFLLAARADGAASPFAPYIATLPTSFPGTPIFWSPEEVQWLEGSSVRDQLDERLRNIRNDYHTISGCVAGFAETHTYEDFVRARIAVSSRNFGIVVDGIRTDALIPLADMLNHQRPRQTSWQFDSTRRAFRIIALQPIAAGQQVFDSYGKKCNSRFLLNYGFTVEHNTDDDTGQCHNETRLFVPLRDAEEDPWHTERLERVGGSYA